MDHVIRQLGYDGQTTGSHRAARERDPTLFAPSRRPTGAHGAFGDEARRFSSQVWARENPKALAGGAAALLVAAIGYLVVRRRS